MNTARLALVPDAFDSAYEPTVSAALPGCGPIYPLSKLTPTSLRPKRINSARATGVFIADDGAIVECGRSDNGAVEIAAIFETHSQWEAYPGLRAERHYFERW